MQSNVYKPAGAPAAPAAGAAKLLARLSLITLATTIVLIALGSFVRVTGHGLGCPDWPLCYGQAIPPLKIGAWVEFSHRFLAGIVGLQILALAVLAWRRYSHAPWVLWPAMTTVAVLAAQVWLGGSHVLNELPAWTGFVHTATAMLMAGLLAVVVAVSQPALRWMGQRAVELRPWPRLSPWATATAVAAYLLLITGSLVTRSGASLACPAFPHCGIVTVPDTLRHLVTLQMIHRYAALIVAAAVLFWVWRLLRDGRQESSLRRYAYLLLTLLVVQVALGISNVLLALPLWSRILHLTVGGAIWVMTVILAVVLHRAEGRREEGKLKVRGQK